MMHARSDAANSDSQRLPEGPLPVAPDCWMVGHRNPQTLLQCNTYLRTFHGAGSTVNLCIDPGSVLDFPVVQANLATLIGGLSEVHAMTINHQDPDVAGNAPFFCEANPKSEMLVTEETWRLLQHMRLNPGSVRLSHGSQRRTAAIHPKHQLQLVPTPFCHFRGAMAVYDPELRTLFTGDLFGGFNRVAAVHLIAEESDWPGIVQFHQIYMPTREVLRHAVREILALRPSVEVIAPQHGHIITGDLVPLFLERLHELPVGHDLVAHQWSEEKLQDFQKIVNALIDRAELSLGREEVARRLSQIDGDEDLATYGKIEGGRLRLERDGFDATSKVFARLAFGESVPFVIALRSIVLAECSERGLPIPPVGAGFQEAGGAEGG